MRFERMRPAARRGPEGTGRLHVEALAILPLVDPFQHGLPALKAVSTLGRF